MMTIYRLNTNKLQSYCSIINSIPL